MNYFEEKEQKCSDPRLLPILAHFKTPPFKRAYNEMEAILTKQAIEAPDFFIREAFYTNEFVGGVGLESKEYPDAAVHGVVYNLRYHSEGQDRMQRLHGMYIKRSDFV